MGQKIGDRARSGSRPGGAMENALWNLADSLSAFLQELLAGELPTVFESRLIEGCPEPRRNPTLVSMMLKKVSQTKAFLDQICKSTF